MDAGTLALKEAKIKKDILDKGIGQKKLKEPRKLSVNQYNALSYAEQAKYTKERRDYKK